MYRFVRLMTLSAVAFCVAVWGTRAAGTAAPGAVIDAPSDWVEFSAALRMERNGEVVHTGRVWQDRNGSFRSETSPSAKPEVRYVVIRNHATNRFFKSLDGGVTWSSHPMDPRPNDGRPLSRRVVPGAFERLAEPYEGFDVYGDARSSARDLTAPALNFFVVRGADNAGWVQAIHDIRVGPQSPELFEPPTGAAVRESDQKAGFRLKSKGTVPRD